MRSTGSTYQFSGQGGVPVSVVLDSFFHYPSVGKGAAARRVDLVRSQQALMSYQFVLGRDTVALDTIPLRVELNSGVGQVLTYAGDVAGHAVRLSYAFPKDTADSYPDSRFRQCRVGTTGQYARDALAGDAGAE